MKQVRGWWGVKADFYDVPHYLTNEGDYTDTLSQALLMKTRQEAIDSVVLPYESVIRIQVTFEEISA